MRCRIGVCGPWSVEENLLLENVLRPSITTPGDKIYKYINLVATERFLDSLQPHCLIYTFKNWQLQWTVEMERVSSVVIWLEGFSLIFTWQWIRFPSHKREEQKHRITCLLWSS